jgi:hypothetical protein
MSIPSIIPITSPIPSFQPTVMQKDLIAGTSIQIGGLEIEGFFSSLQEDLHLAILGDQNKTYNCISWSHGVTNAWNNPPTNPKQYYKKLGFTDCTQGDPNKKIAVWFDERGECMHAAVRKLVTINGSTVVCWTSKLGQSFCIAHSIDRLNGGSYGVPALYFK